MKTITKTETIIEHGDFELIQADANGTLCIYHSSPIVALELNRKQDIEDLIALLEEGKKLFK